MATQTINYSDCLYTQATFACGNIQGPCYLMGGLIYFPVYLAQKIIGVPITSEVVESHGFYYTFDSHDICVSCALLFNLLTTQKVKLLPLVHREMYQKGFVQSLIHFTR